MVVFSHNDIAGLQLGKYISKNGFTINDINSNCSLFINGHLHNATKYNNIVNVGNLTGLNFSEDAFRYKHSVYILDTDTLTITEFENPFAFNFYKITSLQQFSELKSNSVITIQCSLDQ